MKKPKDPYQLDLPTIPARRLPPLSPQQAAVLAVFQQRGRQRPLSDAELGGILRATANHSWTGSGPRSRRSELVAFGLVTAAGTDGRRRLWALV